jgi:hypothetical protein
MTQPAREFLRCRYENLDLHDLLPSAVSVMSRLNDAAVPELEKSGIRTVNTEIDASPDREWPLTSSNADGARLVRAIGEKLQLTPGLVFGDEKFQPLRRFGERGDLALKFHSRRCRREEEGFKKARNGRIHVGRT